MSQASSLGTAILELTGDPSDLNKIMNEAHRNVTDKMGGMAGVVGTAVTGLLASIAALGAGAAAAAKVGLDATMQWGEQLDQLNDLFGLSGEEASTWATAARTVGLSVDEMGSGFSVLIRNLEASRVQSAQAASAYAEAVADISSQHADTMQQIADNWTQSQADAAERQGQLWADLAEKKQGIEEGLAETIAGINTGLDKRLGEMLRDRTKQLKAFEADATKIDKDAAKTAEKTKKDRDKSLAALDRDTTKALARAKTDDEKKRIAEDAALRKQEIEDAAKERLAEIEEQRQERQVELAEKKAQAKEEYEYRVQLAKDEAAERGKQAEIAANKQIAAAEKAAQKQSEALDKMLEKMAKANDKAIEKENKRNEQALEKAQKTLARAEDANPVQKALKKLGIEAFDAAGKIRPMEKLLPEIMDKFKDLPKGVDASALSMQLFGKSGSKFLDFLRLGREGLVQAREQAIAFGLIMSTDAVDATEELGKQFNRVGMIIAGLAMVIGNKALPIVTQLIDQFVAWYEVHGPELIENIKWFIDAIKKGDWEGIAARFWSWVSGPEGVLASAAGQLQKVIDAVGQYLRDNWDPKIKPELEKWATKIWDWVTTAIANLGTELAKLMKAFQTWANSKQTQKDLGQVGTDIGNWIVGAIEALFDPKGNSGTRALTPFAEALSRAVDGLGAMFEAVGGAIAGRIEVGIRRHFENYDWGGLLLFGNNPNISEEDKRNLLNSMGDPYTWFGWHPQGRAMGGPVGANHPVWVGELGPEVFVPPTNGYIVPNHALPTPSADRALPPIQIGTVIGELDLERVILRVIERHDQGLIG